MAEEFKPMGMSMANLTIGYGAMMIIWGIVVSVLSGSNSFTSYIPSLMGVFMIIPGILTNMQPEKKKLWICLLYTSPSPRDKRQSRMPSSA